MTRTACDPLPKTAETWPLASQIASHDSPEPCRRALAPNLSGLGAANRDNHECLPKAIRTPRGADAVTAPRAEEIALLSDLAHSNVARMTTPRLPLAERSPERIRKSKSRLCRAEEQAFWKAAFDALTR